MLKYKTTVYTMISIIVLSLFSCQKEEIELDKNLISKELGYNVIVKTGKLKDFELLNNYIVKNIIEVKGLKSFSRLNLEDENGFTIIDNSITEVNDKNGRSFTLKIVKDEQEDRSFSNLIINFNADNETIAYIINYFPNSDYLLQIESNPDAIFQGEYNMENINYDGDLDVLNTFKLYCFNITNTYCDWGGTEHQAGPNCTAANIYNSSQTVCVDVKEFEDPDTDSDSESGMANTDAGGGGGGPSSSSNPNYVNDCDVNSNIGESAVSDGCDDVNEDNANNNVSSIGSVRLAAELNEALSDYESFEFDSTVNPDESLIFDSVDEFIGFWYYPDGQQGVDNGNINNFQDDSFTSVQHFSVDLVMNTRLKVEVKIQSNGEAEPIEILNVNSSLVGITSFRDWEPNENFDIQTNEDESELTLVHRGNMKLGIIIGGYGVYATATYLMTIKYDLNSGLLLSSDLIIIH